VGKWIDGWLPPADMLEWRLSDEGDQLDIIETVHSTSLQSSGFGGGSERIRRAEKKMSEDDVKRLFDRNGPVEQRLDTKKSVGKIRGRTRDPATDSKLRPSSTGKATPAGPTVTSTHVISVASPMSPPHTAPLTGPSVTVHKDPMSPKSPESLWDKKSFRWSWKSKKKDKRNKEESRRSSLPPMDSSVTVSPRTRDFTDIRERSMQRTSAYEPELEINPFEVDDEEPEPIHHQEEEIQYEDDEEIPAYGPPPRPPTYQQIARYVRYDPHVQWAKKAIWGTSSGAGASRSSSTRYGSVGRNSLTYQQQQQRARGGGGTATATAAGSSPQYGVSRRGTTTTGSVAASSAGKTGEDEDVSRSVEQVGVSDVLVFGEVRIFGSFLFWKVAELPIVSFFVGSGYAPWTYTAM
jgi:hypothetical protein